MSEIEGDDTVVASDWPSVTRWRRAQRERLLAARLALSIDDRTALTHRITANLDRTIGDSGGRIISFYWPFKGEPDLRPWMEGLAREGVRFALPVVIEKARPLEFRLWAPGEALTRGVWNILVPAEGRAVVPDVVLAPVVGFDKDNFRLGYGGGFFDRTLAQYAKKPLVIGIGYEMGRMATIHPQSHDIAMSVVVTEARAGR